MILYMLMESSQCVRVGQTTVCIGGTEMSDGGDKHVLPSLYLNLQRMLISTCSSFEHFPTVSESLNSW